MGIYGGAHTDFDAMDYMTNSVPCMANQLKERYDDAIYSEDLAWLAKRLNRSEWIQSQSTKKRFEASYFGKQDLSGIQRLRMPGIFGAWKMLMNILRIRRKQAMCYLMTITQC